ncbi:MAG: alpha-amylase [Gemmatimonadetes bacterium]|nr:alpha-amylase [Gemmatimonadota bacterium]
MRSKRIFLLALLIPLASSACDDASTDPPLEDGHVFTYTPPAGAPAITSVSVRGAFNDWGETAMERRSDGSWRTAIELEDGTYEYKFFINGVWPTDMCHDETWGDPASQYWIDPEAAGCVPDGHGGQNAVITPGGTLGIGFTHDAARPADVSLAGGRVSVRFRVRQDRTESATVTADGVEHPMHVQLATGMEEVWRASLPESTGTYSFTLQTTDGPETFGPFTVPGELFSAVPWVGSGVGYQIFPERFWNGDPTNDSLTLTTDEFVYNELWVSDGPTLSEDWSGAPDHRHCCHQYFGGDLQGIVDRIGHLEALGVTLIYLNPIWHSGSAHGYDAFDYMQVAPEFGDSAMLRTFVDLAHGAGMRVMWDFVPNHVGLGFWAFQDAVAKGPSSAYWDWFNFHPDANGLQAGDPDDYDGWWGFGSLPELQTENPEVMAHVLDVATHWTEFGFDGIRVDVPFDIDNRQEFFPAFRQATKAVNPEVYLIGEVWQRDPSWLQGDQFDALMNYALGEGMVERFARGYITGSAAAYEMALLYADYPEAAAAMLFNLISSHDTARLLTKMGGGSLGGTPGAVPLARHRLAAALLYALPGIPVTFQGDECAFLGTSEGSRAENRYPFQWDRCDAEMLAHYHLLGGLKASLDASSSPIVRSHTGAGTLLSFYRGEPGPGEMLAAFNNGTTAQALTLPDGSWTDAVSGEVFTGSVSIPELGWRYLRRS